MFRFDAFGQRVLCSPRLSFIKPKEGDSGGGGSDDGTVELDGEKFAFPAKTAVADMTPEQRAEYWRHESKKQQSKGPKKPADYDQLKKDSEDLAQLRAQQTPKEQREEQERLDEARREGEVIGAERYLPNAVKGSFRALTGMGKEDVDVAFEHVNAQSFVGEDGEIDDEKLEKFASTFGAGGGPIVPDPVRDSVKRQQPAGGGGGGQSMKERREAEAARLTKKKQPTNT